MLNLNAILVSSRRPVELADFYAKVLGKPADMVEEENGIWGWRAGNVFFAILKHSEVEGTAKEPARIMLNFETGQVKEEFDRVTAAGAKTIRAPYEMGGGWIATLADPDGNYFQLVTPM